MLANCFVFKSSTLPADRSLPLKNQFVASQRSFYLVEKFR
jgi:hypothetical protein